MTMRLIPARRGELRPGRGRDDVAYGVRARRVIGDRRALRRVLRRVSEMVLLQGSAEADVDQLEAAADPEHRDVARQRAIEQRELDGVARVVDVEGGGVDLAVARRPEKARRQQVVEEAAGAREHAAGEEDEVLPDEPAGPRAGEEAGAGASARCLGGEGHEPWILSFAPGGP